MSLSLYLSIHSIAEKLTMFAQNDIFLPKENNPTKNEHFSKTEDV